MFNIFQPASAVSMNSKQPSGVSFMNDGYRHVELCFFHGDYRVYVSKDIGCDK